METNVVPTRVEALRKGFAAVTLTAIGMLTLTGCGSYFEDSSEPVPDAVATEGGELLAENTAAHINVVLDQFGRTVGESCLESLVAAVELERQPGFDNHDAVRALSVGPCGENNNVTLETHYSNFGEFRDQFGYDQWMLDGYPPSTLRDLTIDEAEIDSAVSAMTEEWLDRNHAGIATRADN